jgi:integral membrane protein
MQGTVIMSDTHLYQVRHLRLASLAEGATLLLLLLVAVPLKRMADLPLAVSIMGPLHGFAFVSYGSMVLWALLSRRVTLAEAAQLAMAAFIPFGAFMLGGLFRRKIQLAKLKE